MSYVQQRTALTNVFGSKKSRSAARSAVANAVNADSVAGRSAVAALLSSKQAEAAATQIDAAGGSGAIGACRPGFCSVVVLRPARAAKLWAPLPLCLCTDGGSLALENSRRAFLPPFDMDATEAKNIYRPKASAYLRSAPSVCAACLDGSARGWTEWQTDRARPCALLACAHRHGRRAASLFFSSGLPTFVLRSRQ
jgi:hypothetical protein